METKISKQPHSVIAFILTLMVLSFAGCKSKSDIVKSPRVYYDFNKKQLYTDAEHKAPQNRPLIVKETNELQVEMSNFNPLNYDIVVKDTAYDRFDLDMKLFNDLIKYPDVKIEPSTKKLLGNELPPDSLAKSAEKGFTGTKKPSIGTTQPSKATSCDSLSTQLKELANISQSLKKGISLYKTYISNIENIISFYDYLKSLEVIDKKMVEDGIVSNIIIPINSIFPSKLKTSSSQVFKNDFIGIETSSYQEILKIKDDLKAQIELVGKFKKPKVCESFDANKAKFDKDSRAILSAIDEFETSHKNIVLPNFTKVMLVYEKLQSLAKADPLFVTKSYPINKDLQMVTIYKYNPVTKSKQEHDAINIQLTRGFRIDVSGGVFVSGLYDKKYYSYNKDSIFISKILQKGTVIDSTISDKFTAIYSTSDAKFSYGGMVYLHGHSQNAHPINYGGYIGLGTLFNDQTRLTVSGGGSLIIGRNSRASINIGLIMAQVNRLDKPYSEGVFYQKIFDKIPVTSVWKSSWMLGFSWKIGK
ncbi:MAG TPA: hypothetical protein DCR40_02615 [Prolixibacteraceae bacterium]|nr:hypothetical protein [Prolixibacteraceae bacterium]